MTAECRCWCGCGRNDPELDAVVKPADLDAALAELARP